MSPESNLIVSQVASPMSTLCALQWSVVHSTTTLRVETKDVLVTAFVVSNEMILVSGTRLNPHLGVIDFCPCYIRVQPISQKNDVIHARLNAVNFSQFLQPLAADRFVN